MRHGLIALLLAALPVWAEPALTVVVARNNAEPLSRFDAENRLVGGILLELGELLGRELAMPVRFKTLPAKRVSQGLRDGSGDLLCYVLPDWIGRDDLHWTPPFLVDAYVVAGHPGSPPLARLEDLSGQRVGTVLGYRYGEVEQRGGFRRDDAPDMKANLRKLAAARFDYALTDLLTLQFTRRDAQLPVRELLRLSSFPLGCALSLRATLEPARLDAAILALQRRGDIERLLARYR